MSPTSYQAAPPRTTTIAERCGLVKSGAEMRERAKPETHQVLYAVPSVAETPVALEWTSTIPLLV
jgi:hypothetical protein